MQFQKITIPTPWKVIADSEGVGVSKRNILKKSMKLPTQVGGQKNIFGAMGILWKHTYFLKIMSLCR